MSNENMNKDQENIQDGQEQKSVEEQISELKKAFFKLSNVHGNALDIIYLQLISIIEILADEGVLTEEKWEEKLKTVTKSLEERIKEKNDKSGSGEQGNEENTDGTDASKGSGKIITPDSGIIIP